MKMLGRQNKTVPSERIIRLYIPLTDNLNSCHRGGRRRNQFIQPQAASAGNRDRRATFAENTSSGPRSAHSTVPVKFVPAFVGPRKGGRFPQRKRLGVGVCVLGNHTFFLAESMTARRSVWHNNAEPSSGRSSRWTPSWPPASSHSAASRWRPCSARGCAANSPRRSGPPRLAAAWMRTPAHQSWWGKGKSGHVVFMICRWPRCFAGVFSMM
jgi:hypothetical protein